MSKERIEYLLTLEDIIEVEPCGSRYTCDPPPVDTDDDYLAFTPTMKLSDAQPDILSEEFELVNGDGYANRGKPFESYRKGEINLILTNDKPHFNKFILARDLCKRFNLLGKQDRIDLHDAVMYGPVAMGYEQDVDMAMAQPEAPVLAQVLERAFQPRFINVAGAGGAGAGGGGAPGGMIIVDEIQPPIPQPEAPADWENVDPRPEPAEDIMEEDHGGFDDAVNVRGNHDEWVRDNNNN